MHGDLLVLLILDLVGTFAFALNGALTAVRVAQVDVVGVAAGVCFLIRMVGLPFGLDAPRLPGTGTPRGDG